ncbi:MAG: hypothetical protein RLZZ242_453 [Bacteroidota bacterium]
MALKLNYFCGVSAFTLFTLPILAVAIGVLLTALIGRFSKSALWVLLPFSGSFLLSITLFELLPELFAQPETKGISLAVLTGILLQIILEFFSKGAEHGHVHLNESHRSSAYFYAVFLALFVHAFIEGAPLSQNEHLSYAVFLHKVPVSMVLFQFLFQASRSKTFSTLALLVFALMTPLGMLLGNAIEGQAIEKYIHALSAGIFLHVSTVILFESEKGHRFNSKKIAAIISAIVVAYFI